MTNEEILKRTWELMPDDITANDFAYTNGIEIRVKEAINLARADERAKVIKEINSLGAVKYMYSDTGEKLSFQITK